VYATVAHGGLAVAVQHNSQLAAAAANVSSAVSVKLCVRDVQQSIAWRCSGYSVCLCVSYLGGTHS
jgi:hypothetical protein